MKIDVNKLVNIILLAGVFLAPLNAQSFSDDIIPDYVYRKNGYIEHNKPPEGFKIIQGWFQVIKDERKKGTARVLVANHELGCFVNGKKVVINHRDYGKVLKKRKYYTGGMYLKEPWFKGDKHEVKRFPIKKGRLIVSTKKNKDKVFHWWTKRYVVPENAENCHIKMRIKITGPGLVQIGIDYWKEEWSFFDNGENNQIEAMASNWMYTRNKWRTIKIGIK